MTQYVVVSGNPRPGSRTSVLATAVGKALARREQPKIIEVGELGAGLLTPGDEATAAAVAALQEADVLVVATPTGPTAATPTAPMVTAPTAPTATPRTATAPTAATPTAPTGPRSERARLGAGPAER